MYKFTGMKKFPEIKSAISTVTDGNMSFLWGEKKEVLESRRRFLENNGFSFERTVNVRTRDTEIIQKVGPTDLGKGMLETDDAIQADGTVTDVTEVTLFLVIADCIPVVIYDREKTVLGLFHINRKNAAIAEKAVAFFQKHFQSDLEDLNVFFGPSIQKDSYKAVDPAQRDLPEWQEFLTDTEDGYTKVNMTDFVKKKFRECGVGEKNIFITKVDTYKEKELFSHYRAAETGEREGRFAVVVKIA